MADYSLDYEVSHDEHVGSCTVRFRCFDTPNAVTVHGFSGKPHEAERVLLDVRATCLDFHRLWSFSSPGSDISRLNAGSGRIAVDPRTADIIARMKAFHEAEPSFDFTIGPVSYLWKGASRLPLQDEIEDAMAHVGAGKVLVDGDTVVKDDPFAQVDVGGAAKGYVADVLADLLRARQVSCADIDLGGNLFLLGSHPEGRPWRVSVKVPEGIAVDPIVVEVTDGAAVTSGSYERYVEIGGVRYQHIVDARTGWPCESDVVSATAFSPSALKADLLATTACLLGSGGLLGLAERHPDCRFVAITFDGTVIRP